MIDIIKKNKTVILLSGIFILALFLRLYRLSSLPFNFHEDELLDGYLGRFILQNGKDLYGNPWPLLYFNKFGDYYIILPMYLSGIATYIFGINEFATRFPTALFGALAVFPVFILAKWIFNNKSIALISSLLIAIMPWHVVLSRSTTEGIIGSTIYITAILFLIKSIQKNNIKTLIVAALILLISYFIYHPFRLYTPLALIACLFIFKEIRKQKRYLIYFILTTLFFSSLTFYISQTPWGKGRFIQTSIFSPLSGVDIRLNKLIFSEGQNHILLARTFHNKVIGYSQEFIKQYLTYFSTIFLFNNGWDQSRYGIPEQGPLYITFAIFIFAAILPIIVKSKNIFGNKLFIYLIFLLLLSPLPAAFTKTESPNVHRSIFITFPLAIFAAYGFYKLREIKYKKLSLAHLAIVLLLFEFVYFIHQYAYHMDLYSSLYRNDGKREIAFFAIDKEKKYDEVILPVEGAMPLYYLFYKQDFNPSYANKFNLDIRIGQTNKIKYIENSCPSVITNPKEIQKKYILVDRYDCVDSDKYVKAGIIKGINDFLAYKVLLPNK